MTTTTTTAAPTEPSTRTITWMPTSGGYGRKAWQLTVNHRSAQVVLVRLPKVMFEQYGVRWMVTDQDSIKTGGKIVSRDFLDKKDAEAFALSLRP